MKINPGNLFTKFADFGSMLKRYSVVLFMLLVLAVYGFMALRITSLQNIKPSSSGAQQATKAVSPRIDPKLVQQLQQLQDNSVSVKSLFDQARSNPFQE